MQCSKCGSSRRNITHIFCVVCGASYVTSKAEKSPSSQQLQLAHSTYHYSIPDSIFPEDILKKRSKRSLKKGNEKSKINVEKKKEKKKKILSLQKEEKYSFLSDVIKNQVQLQHNLHRYSNKDVLQGRYLSEVESISSLYSKQREAHTLPLLISSSSSSPISPIPRAYCSSSTLNEPSVDFKEKNEMEKRNYGQVNIYWGNNNNKKELSSSSSFGGVYWGNLNPFKTSSDSTRFNKKEVHKLSYSLEEEEEKEEKEKENKEMTETLHRATLQDTILGYSRTNRMLRNAIIQLKEVLFTVHSVLPKKLFIQRKRISLKKFRCNINLLEKSIQEAEAITTVANISRESVFRKCIELKTLAAGRVSALLKMESSSECLSFQDKEKERVKEEMENERNLSQKLE